MSVLDSNLALSGVTAPQSAYVSSLQAITTSISMRFSCLLQNSKQRQ